MPNQVSFEFHWLNPLGLSVGLFLLYGAVYVFIGALTPFMSNTEIGRRVGIISARTDRALFGDAPENLSRDNPAFATARTIIFNMLAGVLVTAGTLVIAVAWFGLRQGQAWALAALGLASVVVLPFWWLVFRPYLQAGAPLDFSDMPPYMKVPAVLLVPALVLGWIGLR